MKPLPRFTAVVHVATAAQAIEQTDLALSNGAGGVFLIDHGAGYDSLLATHARVRETFPLAWIGLNFLDLTPPLAMLKLPPDADALWMDTIASADVSQTAGGRQYRIFGGAAFKYQSQGHSPGAMAQDVASRLRREDVVTTSGPGTGQAATAEKVRLMKEVLGDRLLALASGVTPGNVEDYAPFVDCFLVATGISQSFHEFDPAKVRALADRLECNEQNSR